MKCICPHCEQEIILTLFINREVIKTEIESTENQTLKAIAEICCMNAGITLGDFRKVNRGRQIVKTRHQYMFLSKKYSPDTTLNEIAAFIRPELDHSTVIHGIQSIKDLMETSLQEMREIEFLSDRIEDKLLLKQKAI
jgi:chromosomal replication initiation ATPase DnaA